MIESIRSMNATRRFLFIGAAAALIAIVWLVGQWAAAPTYVPLFSELDYKNAAEIGDHLDKADIPNQLGAGGTQVLVPAAEMARARVALARDGVMTGGRPGFELMNKPAWGQTDFEQRVTFQRALEGELARTIGTIRGVQGAQVHLNLPAPTALRRNQSPAGASVVLTLAPGGSLAPDAVDGITYIVSNSVDQLSPDNVAVMDDAGRVLSIPASGGGAATGMTSRQLAMQRSVEEHLSAKAERLLETVVGTGRARAQVAAQLSFDQVDRTIDTFDPNTQVLQTEQRSESEGAGAGTQTIVSNAYQNSRRLEKTVGSVGDVTRLTVAVLVDAAALDAQGADGAGAAQAVRVEDLEAMVRDAIGVDEQRGDRISVKVVPFEPVVTPEATLASAPGSGGPGVIATAERFSRPAIGLVAIVALVLLAFRAMKAPALAPSAAVERTEMPQPAQLNGAGSSDRNGTASDATADVLRAWLAERA